MRAASAQAVRARSCSSWCQQSNPAARSRPARGPPVIVARWGRTASSHRRASAWPPSAVTVQRQGADETGGELPPLVGAGELERRYGLGHERGSELARSGVDPLLISQLLEGVRHGVGVACPHVTELVAGLEKLRRALAQECQHVEPIRRRRSSRPV